MDSCPVRNKLVTRPFTVFEDDVVNLPIIVGIRGKCDVDGAFLASDDSASNASPHRESGLVSFPFATCYPSELGVVDHVAGQAPAPP
ncbi:hypothetical protein A9K55_000832 [Cordyceps militaris]|uniref:Uncharacterized protein n=1 Tax=Cordyceps militaris TaxID=73501 RepID=A0A2H4SU82_CORMI|nr:hypothetical protein A9K55_000832 [Cordyceps militaris]